MPDSLRGVTAPPVRFLGSTALTPVPGARDPKFAERIAAAIEADVIRDGWPVGKVLGSEEQLSQRYGVGRAVLREGIRLSEHRQVVRMRRGRGGGLVVVEPDASAVTESMAIFLEYTRADHEDLLEAQAVLEGFSAAVAAAVVPPTSVIRRLNEPAQAVPDCAGAPTDPTARTFHDLVAESTGSTALVLFIRVLATLSSRLMARDYLDTETPGLPGVTHLGRHPAIVAAIAAGDSDMARRLAQADMGSLRDRVIRMPPAADRPDAGGGIAFPAAQPRPADLVAARIRRDIIDRGWPVGESLGFEADLLQQYGIGRAQFREAIRILENHSVVSMQRGAAGGMLVGAPDGRAVVRAASLYLTFKGVDPRDIRNLRADLEAATARLTIDRLTPEKTERLRAVLELERLWPDEDFRAVSHDLHAVIAELSDNRTLGLLQSIVMQLTAERLYTLAAELDHSDAAPRAADTANSVRRTHKAIVEAIIARNATRAIQLLDEHIRAIARPTIEGLRSHL